MNEPKVEIGVTMLTTRMTALMGVSDGVRVIEFHVAECMETDDWERFSTRDVATLKRLARRIYAGLESKPLDSQPDVG